VLEPSLGRWTEDMLHQMNREHELYRFGPHDFSHVNLPIPYAGAEKFFADLPQKKSVYRGFIGNWDVALVLRQG
jgi:hypothetical protein